MNKAHTFQAYSQRENWVTNNTILFLSRINSYSHRKFEKIIAEILGDQIGVKIGAKFTQQEKSVSSVFDAVIEQQEFKIAIETKLFDNFSEAQLHAHIDGLASNGGKNRILLALSKNEVSSSISISANEYIKNKKRNVRFATCSFGSLIETARYFAKDHEEELIELIDEYEAFCEENRILEHKNDCILAVTASTSINENLKYAVYYDPVDRNHSRSFDFLALYQNKSIIAIGKLEGCFEVDLIDNELIIHGAAIPTDEQKERIKSIIIDTKYYEIGNGHKFYLVDKFYETSFNKVSSGSLRGKRYFSVKAIIPGKSFSEASFLAKELRNHVWGNDA